jgi:hypothetical protein
MEGIVLDFDPGYCVSNMIIYRVFCKNYDLRKVELVGVLTERRNDLRGKTRFESASRWAKLMFGQLVRDKHAIFVVPDELNLKKDYYSVCGEDDIQLGGVLGKERKFTLRFFRFSCEKTVLLYFTPLLSREPHAHFQPVILDS